jgi:hypothetical protein
MKLLETASVLFALVCSPLVASAQGVECFCSDGASVPAPDQKVRLSESTETTCGKLQEESTKRYQVEVHGCSFYQYYGFLCGCSSPIEPVCSLCQDGQELNFTSTEVTKSSTSMDDCQTQAIEALFDPFKKGCGFYHYVGSHCGCQSNKPADEYGCTICSDGSAPTLASKQVHLEGLESRTCQDINERIQYDMKNGSRQCTASQATLGQYCGCNSTQPTAACSICGTKRGLVVSNDLAPDFTYMSPNGGTNITQTGITCLEAEMLAHGLYDSSTGSEICIDLRKQLVRSCCKDPSSPPSSPVYSVSENQTTVVSSSSSSGALKAFSTVAFVVTAIAGFWQVAAP